MLDHMLGIWKEQHGQFGRGPVLLKIWGLSCLFDLLISGGQGWRVTLLSTLHLGEVPIFRDSWLEDVWALFQCAAEL